MRIPSVQFARWALAGSGGDLVNVNSDNVAVGVAAPSGDFKFEVGGHIGHYTDNLYDFGSPSKRVRASYAGPLGTHFVTATAETGVATDWSFSVRTALGAGRANLSVREASPVLEMTLGGDVGVGVITPEAKLHVDGNIIANDPTAPNHVVTQQFMASIVANIDWQESVLSQALLNPPGVPTSGDRYIIAGQGGTATGAWVGEEKKVAQWSGTDWTILQPNEGWAVWIEDEDVLYLYNGAFPGGSWVKFGSTITHANLIGNSADDHPHYFLADGSRDVSGSIIPSVDNGGITLGRADRRFDSIHVGPSSLHIDSSASETGTAKQYLWDIDTAVGATRGFLRLKENVGVSELLTIDPVSNRLGVNQATPADALDVTGSINFTSALRQGSVDRISATGIVRAADGTFAAPGLSFSAQNTLGIYRVSSNVLGISTNSLERMRIDSAGRVGIGASPVTSSILNVAGTLNIGAADSFSIDENIILGPTTGGMHVGTDVATDALIFRAGGTEAARLDTSGRLGIGVTPLDKLHVAGSAALSEDSYLRFITTGGNNRVRLQGTSSDHFIITNTSSNTERLRIISTGEVGLGTSAPTHSLTLPSTASGVALYNTVDQTINYERTVIEYASNTFKINSEAGGSGVARGIAITHNGAGPSIFSQRMTFAGSGSADGTGGYGGGYYILRTIGDTTGLQLLGGKTTQTDSPVVLISNRSAGLSASSGVQIMAAIDTTIDQSGTAGYTGLELNLIENTVGSGTKSLIDAQVGGVSKFLVSNEGDVDIFGDLNVSGGFNLSGHLIPDIDITYDIGENSTPKRWRAGYFGPSSLHVSSTAAETTSARDWMFAIQETAGANQGNLRIMEGASEHLTIATDGDVGIGIATPNARLHVANGDVYIMGGANRRFLMGDSTGGGQWGGMRWNTTTDVIQFIHSGFSDTAGVLTADASGNVGVQTDAPTHALTFPSASTGIALYNTADQTVDYERGVIEWSSNVLTIGTSKGGSGSVRQTHLLSNGSGLRLDGTNAIRLVGTSSIGGALAGQSITLFGNVTTQTTASVQIGAGNSLSSSTSAQIAARVYGTIGQSGTAGYTGLLVDITETLVGSGAKNLIDVQVGGSSKFSVANDGTTQIAGQMQLVDGSAGAPSYSFSNYATAGMYTASGDIRFSIGGIDRWGITTGGNLSALSGAVEFYTGTGTEALPSVSFTTNTNSGLWSPGAGQLGLSANGSEAVRIDASQNVLVGTTSVVDSALLTVAGTIAASTPTALTHLATKAYVDGLIQGLEWQESVLDQDLATPPGIPTTGDRYIITAIATGAWATHEEKIAEWNGTSWDIITPDEGFAVWVEDENKQYTYNGAHPAGTWVTFGSTQDHGALLGLTDVADHPSYLLLDGTRPMTGLLAFNGLTSGDAGLKAVGTAIYLRKADDSDYATLICSNITSTGNIIVSANGRLDWAGRSSIYSAVDGNLELYNNAKTDFSLLQFGGVTSAFPAIKRSGTQVHARLADDSAWASLKAGSITAAQAITAGGANPISFVNRTRLTSPADSSLLLQNWAQTDFGLLQLGGTTSAFPAIKRNGGNLDIRKADDSAYTDLNANNLLAFGSLIRVSTAGRFEISNNMRLSSGTVGNLLLTNGATTDFGLLQLGGTTSSFPAIKRAGAAIRLRTADDSGDAQIICGTVTAGTITGTSLRVGAAFQVHWFGQSAIWSPVDGNIQLTNDAKTNFGLLQFGGTTSAFPAIKRNGADIDLRLADDTGYAGILAKFVNSTSSVRTSAGGMFYWDGRSRMFSGADGNIMLTYAANANFNLLQFGGSSAAYPALKRNGTGIDVKLADDSALTNLAFAGMSIESGSITSTLTGSSGVEVPFEIATTVNQTLTAGYTLFKANATETLIGSGVHQLMDLQVGGISKFLVDNTGLLSLGAGTEVSSAVDGNLLLTNAAGTDFGRIQLGGTTSAYPSIVRSGNQLLFKKADDSGFIQANASVFYGTFAIQSAGQVIAATNVVAGATGNVSWTGKSEMTSPTNGNILLTDAAGTDFSLIQLGGTTSSFPAIGRSGSNVWVRKADNSAYADFSCQRVFAAGNIRTGAGGAVHWQNRSEMYSPLDGNITLYNDAKTDFGLLQFGGTTSAFPALKRDGTNLRVRKADDSGDATLFMVNAWLASEGLLLFGARTTLRSFVDGNLTLRNGASTDFGLLQFGGTTSSYPAIKRNGAGIDIRLADDTGYGDLAADTITASDRVLVPDGTTGAPSYSFTDYPTIGMRASSGQVRFVTGGTDRWAFNASGDFIAIGDRKVRAGNGSVTIPSLSFTGSTTSGLYLIGTDIIGWGTAAVEALRVDASQNVLIGTSSIIDSALLTVDGTVAASTPTADTHLATKLYVDNLITGLDWQKSVLDQDLFDPPGGETTGDRYIVTTTIDAITAVDITADWFKVAGDITSLLSATDTFTVTGSTGNDGTYTIASIAFASGSTQIDVNEDITNAVADGDIDYSANAWNNQDEKIAEYNGSGWDFITPNEGYAVWVDDEDSQYVYSGTHPAGTWVIFSTITDHGGLAGLTDVADHPGYLTLDGTRGMTGDLLPDSDLGAKLGESVTPLRWSEINVGPSSLHIVSTAGETTTGRDFSWDIQTAGGATQGNIRLMEGASELLTVTPGGNVGIGTVDPGSPLTVTGVTYTTALRAGVSGAQLTIGYGTTEAIFTSRIAAERSLVVRGTTSQTGDVFCVTDVAKTANYFLVDSGGNIGINAPTPAALLHVRSSSAAAAGGILLRDTDNAVDLLRIYESAANTGSLRLLAAGTENVTLTGDGAGTFAGNVGAATLTATGAVTAGAGSAFLWTGKTKITSPSDGNVLLTDAVGTDFGLLQFGGTTSAFPAIKRSGTTLQARLADDSDYAGLAAISLVLDGAAASDRSVEMHTAGARRWVVGANDTAESGSNVGSDYVIERYNDAGSTLGVPLTILRSNGFVGLNQGTPTYGLHLNNATSASTGALYVGATTNSSGTGLVIDTNTRDIADIDVLAFQSINRVGETTFSVDVAGNVILGTDTSNLMLELVSSHSRHTYYNTANVGHHIVMRHARGTKASPVASVDADHAGTLLFQGMGSGLGWSNVALIRAIVTNVATSVYGDLTFTTRGVTSGTSEKLRIRSDGNVQIGNSIVGSTRVGLLRIGATSNSSSQTTDSSSDDLVLESSGHAGMTILSGNGSRGRVTFADNNDNIVGMLQYNHSTNAMLLHCNNVDALVIDSGQSVRIGAVVNSTRAAKLHVGTTTNASVQTTNTSSDEFVIESAGATGMTILSGTSSVGRIAYADTNDNLVGMVEYNHASNFMRWYVNDAEVMRIDSTGQVGLGVADPLSRLDVLSTVTDSAIHIGTTANEGGWLTSATDNQFSMAGGAAWQASLFVAKSTAASAVVLQNGDAAIWGDTGLTDGVAYSPTSRMIVKGDTGNVGIGTINPNAGLHIIDAMMIGQDVETDAASKAFRYTCGHYTNAEQPVAMIVGSSTAAANTVNIGGGTALANAATSIVFRTAANSTTVTGTERMEIASDGDVTIGSALGSTRVGLLRIGATANTSVQTTDPAAATLVLEGSGHVGMTILSGSSSLGQVTFADTNDNLVGLLEYNHATNAMRLYVNNGDALTIDSGRSVRIGAVTGSSRTAKLHVGSTVNTSVQTTFTGSSDLVLESSGHAGMTILSGNTSVGRVTFADTDDNLVGMVEYDHDSNIMGLYVNNDFALKIDSGRSVRIGAVVNSTRAAKLHVGTNINNSVQTTDAIADDLVLENSGYSGMTILSGNAHIGRINFADTDANLVGMMEYNHADNYMRWYTNVNEAMRIDSSQRLLIGLTTGTSNTTVNIKGATSSNPYDGQLLVIGSETTGAAGTGAGLRLDGHDGSVGRVWGAIRCLKENSTVGNLSSYMTFSTRPSSGTPLERMRINSTGQVGIGRTPSVTLDINSGEIWIRSAETGNVRLELGAGAAAADGAIINAQAGGSFADLHFQTNGTDRMVLQSDGRLGIGTPFTGSNVGYKLDVSENRASSYAANFFNDGNVTTRWGIRIQAGEDTPSGTNRFIQLVDGNGTSNGGVHSIAGATPVFFTGSDERLKEDIAPTKVNGLDVINRLKLYEFRKTKASLGDERNPDAKLTPIGWIGQQAKKVWPGMVGEDDTNTQLNVGDGCLIPVLTKAIQELSEKLAEALSRLTILEAA